MAKAIDIDDRISSTFIFSLEEDIQCFGKNLKNHVSQELVDKGLISKDTQWFTIH
jgi:hypothetical protein